MKTRKVIVIMLLFFSWSFVYADACDVKYFGVYDDTFYSRLKRAREMSIAEGRVFYDYKFTKEERKTVLKELYKYDFKPNEVYVVALVQSEDRYYRVTKTFFIKIDELYRNGDFEYTYWFLGEYYD